MAVKPRRGDAVLFFSFDEAGRSDHASTHASCPTLGGTKWTATKWIHEATFETGTWTRPTCEDKERRCGDWAAAGECAKNPGFMLGTEVAGSCLKSCCAGAVEMPETPSQGLAEGLALVPSEDMWVIPQEVRQIVRQEGSALRAIEKREHSVKRHQKQGKPARIA